MHACTILMFSACAQRCLVLQLCTGGALDARLARKTPAAGGAARPEPLQWQHRVRIALGIARALECLHSLTPQMIHRCALWGSRKFTSNKCPEALGSS